MSERWTVEQVNEAVERIRAISGDAEMAHSAEDALHQGVLGAIASGACDDPVGCAAAALKTDDIKFPR